LERRAYCSENLRMTSTDLSLEASAPAAAHNRYHISEGRAEIGGVRVLHESRGIGANVP
jgi:hypothetical protein